jgi:hypothetical protein
MSSRGHAASAPARRDAPAKTRIADRPAQATAFGDGKHPAGSACFVLHQFLPASRLTEVCTFNCPGDDAATRVAILTREAHHDCPPFSTRVASRTASRARGRSQLPLVRSRRRHSPRADAIFERVLDERQTLHIQHLIFSANFIAIVRRGIPVVYTLRLVDPLRATASSGARTGSCVRTRSQRSAPIASHTSRSTRTTCRPAAGARARGPSCRPRSATCCGASTPDSPVAAQRRTRRRPDANAGSRRLPSG